MSEPFIGEIVMFAGNFAPRGWAFCSGQILSIAQNTALFSILGTTYGGNGQTTFALPNLQGRVPIHPGQGAGLSPYVLGQQGGTENVTLLTTQMPQHTHTVACSGDDAALGLPAGNYLATTSSNVYASTAGAFMNNATINPVGGNQPHVNLQPYLCVNFLIALVGIFPSRN
jgi:microcystin-dependent protein